MGLLHPPGWRCCTERRAPPKKDGVCNVEELLCTGVLVAVPSALSPETQIPVSPHTTPVHPTLLLPKPRVSGWKWYFVHWPFRRVPVSLADSLLSLIFIARCYVSFFGLRCSGLGSLLWGWDPTLLGETLQLGYPSGISASNHVSGARTFCISALLTVSMWLFL